MRTFPEAERPPGVSDRPVEELERIGGSLVLDFVNTVGGTRRLPTEYLPDYEALCRWARAAEVIDQATISDLERRARARPDQAATVHERALELREALYRLFEAVAAGESPDGGDLARLNQRLDSALAGLRVVPGDGGYVWRFEPGAARLDAVLDPIARDAAELLVSDELGRIKQCGGEDCAWLFIDASRNRSRRWCDMADCGNRAKQRRHYRRQRRSRRD